MSRLKVLPLADRERQLGLKPHRNDRLERAVLGCMIIRDYAIFTALTKGITREHFYGYQSQIVFDAICRLYEAMTPVDFISLENEIREMGQADDCPMGFLQDLFDVIPTAANVSHYCDRLSDLYDRRRKEADTVEALRLMQEGDQQAADELLRRAADRQPEKRALPTKEMQLKELDTVLEEEAKLEDGVSGFHTGFTALDHKLGGLARGRSYAIGGRTGEGKTAITMQIALTIAMQLEPVYVFSLEMPSVDLYRRLVALLSGVPLPPGAPRRLTPEQLERVRHGRQMLANIPIQVDDRSLNLDQMRAEARRLAGRVGLIVIDHARLVEVPGATEYESVTRVSRAAKRIAVDCNAAVILVCQINREGAKDGSPKLHHIQSSGAIGQDSDAVMLIQRNAYGKPGSTDRTGRPDRSAALKLLKNRHYGGACIELQWQPHLARFVETGEVSDDGE